MHSNLKNASKIFRSRLCSPTLPSVPQFINQFNLTFVLYAGLVNMMTRDHLHHNSFIVFFLRRSEGGPRPNRRWTLSKMGRECLDHARIQPLCVHLPIPCSHTTIQGACVSLGGQGPCIVSLMFVRNSLRPDIQPNL